MEPPIPCYGCKAPLVAPALNEHATPGWHRVRFHCPGCGKANIVTAFVHAPKGRPGEGPEFTFWDNVKACLTLALLAGYFGLLVWLAWRGAQTISLTP